MECDNEENKSNNEKNLTLEEICNDEDDDSKNVIERAGIRGENLLEALEKEAADQKGRS